MWGCYYAPLNSRMVMLVVDNDNDTVIGLSLGADDCVRDGAQSLSI